MPKPTPLADYLTLAIERFNEALLQTGAGIGQAVLFLTVSDTTEDQRDEVKALAAELGFAQDRIALIRADLTTAAKNYAKKEH